VAAGDNRFDAYQRTHAWIGVPVAVIYKLIDDQGTYLAALLTYYGFLSLFPLLLLGASVLGFVLNGNPQIQHKILSSAVAEFPVVGNQLHQNIHGYTGSGFALVSALLVGLYGALGIAQAGQNAMNIVWGVPRNARPNPIKARLRSLMILSLIGLGVLATTALSALATGAHALINSLDLGLAGRGLAIAASTVLDVALFVMAFRILTTRRTSFRDVAVGAIAAGVAWEILQDVGTYYMAHELKGAREIYGVFAVVIGLMAWIYLEAVIVVFCAELNTVLRHHLWPRSLLTPFTDNVDLTGADEAAYGSYAKAQRFKGFERVDVNFDKDTTEVKSEPEDET
jgi:membrane protein